MRIRYVPANPAGNLTGMVMTPVPADRRAALASALMAHCPQGFEQIAFVDEASLVGPMPRMEMMGGEFCGNATRAFALMAAERRGIQRGRLEVSVSGAREPVSVEVDRHTGCAYAQMPLPCGVQEIETRGMRIPVVRMEGIAHAVLGNQPPSPALAQAICEAMPKEDAQGVMFMQGGRLTPLVFVAATGTSVWESSCGSGTVAAGWLTMHGLPDGLHRRTFEEPGGRLTVCAEIRAGKVIRMTMGGAVSLSAEREIELEEF